MRTHPSSRRFTHLTLTLVVMAMLATACFLPDIGGDGSVGEDGDLTQVDPGDCVVVDMSVSSEKIDLLNDLANQFNNSGAEVDGRCIFVRPQSKSSGGSATLLSEGWDEGVEGPLPVIWSPAGSTWGAVLNHRLSQRGEAPIAPTDFEPFMLTPLVIAMPEPMAEALGYPDEQIGWNDILRLSQNPEGWAAFGHPEWGPFRLGKTNPNFSTSGLAALVAQYYALADKTRDLTGEDIARADVVADARSIENSVVHYGDTTLTFLNNWYRNDARGTALTYASAVAIEEVSLINYNRGNPDGVIEPGEEVIPPKIPLVAIYPEEGTLFSDNPFFILEDAEWVDDDEAAAAELFTDFVQQPENQERVLEFGFRPGNINVPVADPIILENGVDPGQPSTTLQVPSPSVLVALIEQWGQTRKAAQVMLVLDVSGSMGDPAESGSRDTKLELATRAATTALDQFIDDDIVGLRVFTTDIGADDTGQPLDYLDIVPLGPVRTNESALRSSLASLIPLSGTPLYTVTRDSFDDIVEVFDPSRINAVVLLTDGTNDDPRNSDLVGLVQYLESQARGETSAQVRVFPIGYGATADFNVLEQIAVATNARSYDASDPRSIDKVFTAVISNF